jgi:PKD repeat protein
VIKVNARPQFSTAVQAALFCQGLPLNFSSSLDVNQPVSYLWNFGDGSSDTLKNPIKTYADSGSYQVILRVITENGCFSDTPSTDKTGTECLVQL